MKDWDEIIPEGDRKRIDEEEAQRVLQELISNSEIFNKPLSLVAKPTPSSQPVNIFSQLS